MIAHEIADLIRSNIEEINRLKDRLASYNDALCSLNEWADKTDFDINFPDEWDVITRILSMV